MILVGAQTHLVYLQGFSLCNCVREVDIGYWICNHDVHMLLKSHFFIHDDSEIFYGARPIQHGPTQHV
jgi:hypothetical protein